MGIEVGLGEDWGVGVGVKKVVVSRVGRLDFWV